MALFALFFSKPLKPSTLETEQKSNSKKLIRKKGGQPCNPTLSCDKSNRNKECTYIVIGFVPISSEKPEVTVRRRERDGDARTAPDTDGSECTSGLVEGKRREVVEATDLIFNLNYVSEVFAWWDRTCCPYYSILI